MTVSSGACRLAHVSERSTADGRARGSRPYFGSDSLPFIGSAGHMDRRIGQPTYLAAEAWSSAGHGRQATETAGNGPFQVPCEPVMCWTLDPLVCADRFPRLSGRRQNRDGQPRPCIQRNSATRSPQRVRGQRSGRNLEAGRGERPSKRHPSSPKASLARRRCSRTATAASSARDEQPSLNRMCSTCVEAVRALM